MGNNLDLNSLLSLPIKIKCPTCKRKIKSYFDDYDIECGSPDASNYEDGYMRLMIYCDICETTFYGVVESKIKSIELD